MARTVSVLARVLGKGNLRYTGEIVVRGYATMPGGIAHKSGLSRLEALRLGALGLSGLVTAPVLAGCRRLGAAASGGDLVASGPRLAPFDSTQPAGPATGLPRRIAWANTSDAEIFAALGNGIAFAAAHRGLGSLTANAHNDPGANVDQMHTFLARTVGGMVVQPLDETAQAPVMAHALEQGVCVQGIITHPCTLQIAASQYRIGYTQGKAAVQHANAHLGGRAGVLYFNQDQLSPQLRMRHLGVLSALRTSGGTVRVVSDISAGPSDGSIQGGYELMVSAMQVNPGIRIILGSDALAVGAYRALEQTGRLTKDMYLSGVDGDSNALELVKQGGPYRASLAFAWPLMGYGMGQFTADWIDGRQIPRVMVANATLLDSPGRVSAFQADNADPAGVFADRGRYRKYLPLFGNVGHQTRHTVWRQDYVPR